MESQGIGEDGRKVTTGSGLPQTLPSLDNKLNCSLQGMHFSQDRAESRESSCSPCSGLSPTPDKPLQRLHLKMLEMEPIKEEVAWQPFSKESL